MSWAEYEQGTNAALRVVPFDGQRAMSRAGYNARVQKWLDAADDYRLYSSKEPVRVRLPLPNVPCKGADGSVASLQTPTPQAQWLLLADPGYPVDAPPAEPDPSSLPECSKLVLMDSAFDAPDALLGDHVSSVLVRSSDGRVVEQALGGNYFAIETGLFEPHRDGKCDRGLGEDRKASPGELIDEFVDCDPSEDQGWQDANDRIWAPIQGVSFTVSSGLKRRHPLDSDRMITAKSNPRGDYSIPLSFPFLERLSVSRLDPFIGAGDDAAFFVAANQPYVLSAEVRYDTFNPRYPKAGYFILQSQHLKVHDKRLNFKNYVVDATTITIDAKVSKTPRALGELVPVPVVGSAFGLPASASGSEYTEFDLRPLDRGEVADAEGLPENQGLLEQIYIEDLANTDTYVFRESDGRLIGTRQGLSLSAVPSWSDGREFLPEPICETNACLIYSMITRGPGSSPFFGNGRELNPNGWTYDRGGTIGLNASRTSEALTTEEQARLGHYKSFVRYGDFVRIGLINRATGYMAAFRAKVDVRGSGLPTYVQVTEEEPLGSAIANVTLRPPNLKLKVERVVRERGASSCGANAEKCELKIVGADGAAITDDTWLQITTEWFDEDGGPLPEDLPGFTGRLARVVEGNLVAGTEDESAGGDDVGHFPIRPGRHIVNLQLPSGGKLSRSQFYVHVSAAASNELAVFARGTTGRDKPNFTPNQVCREYSSDKWTCSFKPSQEGFEGRPPLTVPFQVARFDREYTKALAEQHILAAQQALESGSPMPVLEEATRVYRLIYSPEMHFSVYDLEVTSVEVKTRASEDSNPTLSVAATYDLSKNTDPLARPGHTSGSGKDSGLDWGVGYDKMEAMFGEGSALEWVEKMTPDEFLALDLFVDGDEDNPLFVLENLALLYGFARPLFFERLMRTSFTEDGVPTAFGERDTVEVLRVVTTREVRLDLFVEQQVGAAAVRTPVWTGSPVREAGEHFIPLEYQDIVDAGVDPSVDPAFTLIVRATNTDDAVHTHELEYPGLLAERREDFGEGMSLDSVGKFGRVSGADGQFDETSGGASPEAQSARGTWAQGGASLADGSLRLQREDFGVANIGPALEFKRSYTNLDTVTSTSTLGVGWNHNMNIELIPIALEGESRQAVPEWFKKLKRAGIPNRASFKDLDLPEHWGEVLVRGVRFKRLPTEVWRAERG
ncbi:MAG: hypothetical protein AAGI01_01875, partial [Myxococcota bacterium]